MRLTVIQISDIRTDGGTQSRDQFDMDLVSEYSKAMHEGADFPPMHVFFDGTNYWLADGFHRHKACTDVGLEFVEVTVQEGSLRDAQLYSFSANANHGKRRTNADKRKAVMAMLADAEWSLFSDREIARVCQVSNDFVSRQRKESSLSLNDSENPAERTYTTKHGTQAKMNTANIGRSEQSTTPPPLQPAEPVSTETEDDTPPPEALEYTAEQAQADVQEKFAQEHELRMAELAHLMGEEGQLANALKEVERLSLEIAQRDEMVSMYKMRLNGMTSEMNVLKKEVAKYKKAFATFDIERKK